MRTILIIILLSAQVFSQSQIKVIKHLDGITVYDLFGDGKSVWAATNGNGIFSYSFQKKKWVNYSTSNNKLQMDFFYALDGNNDFIWAGSTDGLFILNRKNSKWTKRKFGKGGQLSNWIRSVKYDPIDKIVWIGRFQFLTKLDLKRRRFIDYDLTVDKDRKTNTIKVIHVDGDSLVWFGTENGLHKYDKSRSLEEPGAVTFYDNSKNYFQGDGEAVSISAILLEQNNVWIGLDEFITRNNPDYNLGGVYKFDRRNNWTKFDERKGLLGNGVFDLILTGNYIWASVYQFSINSQEIYGRGLVMINRLTEEVTQIENQQLPRTIYSIYYDAKFLWLGASDGLYQLDLSNNLVTDLSKIRK